MLATLAAFAVMVVALFCYGQRLRQDAAAMGRQLEDMTHSLSATRRDLDGVIRDRHKVEQDLNRVREEAERAIKAKGEFLANMSHIRTPMNGVLGMTELLLGTKMSQKQHHFAETIRRCGEQLLVIINDILDFSKIEAGKLQLNETVFDLRQLLEDVNDMFADKAHGKGLELTSVFPTDLHAVYQADAFRLKQVLTNLVGNAVKFTERGEVVTRVECLSEKGNRVALRIEVSDTGIGIRAEALTTLFTAFSQADASATREFGGTGLGLAICKQLIRLMSGDIGVASEPGRGSTFWVTLELPRAPAQVSAGPTGMHPLHGLRALIVDDNATMRESLRLQLNAWEMRTYAVSSGSRALAALRKAVAIGRPFDVTIFDLDMPGMNGIELVRGIKGAREIAEVRLIMLSAIGNLEQTGQWIAAGVDAYIDKPVRQLELQKCLLRILGRAERIEGPPVEPATAGAARFNAHVLVAEDNLVNQELIVAMLEGFGCRVRVVANGREAAQAITCSPLDQTHDPYDLVLMDCQMPEMDGYAASAEIRQWEWSERSAARLPIIALTASAMEGDRERCLAAGMDDYLAKPLSQAQLADLLRRWLPLQSVIKPAAAASADASSSSETERRSVMTDDALDISVLNRIRALQRLEGPDLLARVIHLYLEKSPELVTAIRDSVSHGEADKLRQSAHSLKSASANLGAEKVAAACKELEQMGRAARLAGAEAALGVLEFEFQSACEALKAHLTRRAA
ncbi:MAG: response regulator [Chromatiales bacterium]